MRKIEVICRNNGQKIKVEHGTMLCDIYSMLTLTEPQKPVAAKVNNEVMSLSYRVFGNKTIEFIDKSTSAGMRIYRRTLFFVLCKAVHDVYPEGKLSIEFSISNGYYCRLAIGHPITPDDANALRKRMQEIIDQDIRIKRHQRLTSEAVAMLRERGDESKAMLLEGLGRIYTVYTTIDDYADYFYGPTLLSTGSLDLFDLVPYFDGLLLRMPSTTNPEVLGPVINQEKLYNVFKEYHGVQDTIGISTVGQLNDAVTKGFSKALTLVFEALQEKSLAHIADDIAKRGNVKVVLIAGPSSSGKTTTCKRLSIQLGTHGYRPIGISLDDYYVDRDKSPLDENGEYDFESLYALNLPLLNEQISKLISGEEVELPLYDFKAGLSKMSGRTIKMHDGEVLVIEGIHALNPELITQIPQEQIYRVYASALTTICLDTHNYIPTTDNRLLRRMIRDYKYRGTSAQSTIRRWASVRRGEEKWIFPFQENADAIFNTAMIFELGVIKQQAETVLSEVPENCEEYSEARRLLDFLQYIKPIPESQIPLTSLLREFLGGSTFEY